MKLLVDSVMIFVVMLLAAGAIAQGDDPPTRSHALTPMEQAQSDHTLALLASLLD